MDRSPEHAAFPLEDFAADYFQEIRDVSIEPTGVEKSFYLDLAERIVRVAVAWQDDAGRIIDPNVGEEWNHSSPRYASSVAPLIAMGRCEDLLDSCIACIDVSVSDLAAGQAKAPDFAPRDLVLAIDCLKGKVDEQLVARWKNALGTYDPQEMYVSVSSKKKPEDIHNFSIYNFTGEQMKRYLGAANNIDFIDEHIEIQKQKFNAYGMYCDPNCPMTYDLTDRQNLVLMLRYGYDGKHRAFLDEMLRRGGLTQLFYQSTTGEAPFGGRSNQFHHMEGMFACNAEFEAGRYAAAGDKQMAGVFKRAARRAVLSTARWVRDATPFRHIKNMYDPATLHGCDSYGHVSVYSLLASNLFAYAALIADDSIPEQAAPCDVGGYVVPILEGFHRVYASCGPLHLAIDTCAQPGYDATGLCRLHHRDAPSELALSLGICWKPHYKVTEPSHSDCAAIGPCWQCCEERREYTSLAATHPTSAGLTTVERRLDRVAFRLVYELEAPVVEEYVLTPDALELTATCATAPIRFTVPLILSDGAEASSIQQGGGGFTVGYRGATFRAECRDEATSDRLGVRAPNRNAVYDIGCFDAPGKRIRMRFTVT